MRKNGKTTKRIITVFALVFALTLSLIVPFADIRTGAADAVSQSYQDKISELESRQNALKSQIAELDSEMTSAMEYKSSLDELGNVTGQKIAAAEAFYSDLDVKIENTTNSIAQKETDIQVTFNKFLDRMVASYEEGEASYLTLILGTESLSDFLTKYEMVSSMLEYDRELRIQYQNEKTELEAEKESLEEAKLIQADLLETLNADKAEYEALSSQQENYISSLQSDASAANAALEEAQAEEAAIDAQLQAYLQSLQQKEQISYVGGEFIWPLPGYTSISSGFGWRELFGVMDYHRGIDIPAPGGTPIHASNGGTVVTATGSGSYGNYVVINHGGGKSTLYAHMSAIGCCEGQSVSQGDVIGYVGTTGYSTGNHLHIEVRIDGVANDPLAFLAR